MFDIMVINNSLVSIIIPCYNSSYYLAETITSLYSQTYENWEAILVDDGSTDDTCKLIEHSALLDKRIRLYKRIDEVKGVSSCRNIGIKNAIGKYVIFLDSDDLLLPHCLEQRVNEMELNTQNDFAVFNMHTFSMDLNESVQFTKLDKKNVLYCFLATDILWNPHCVIWKLEFLKEIGGFDISFKRLEDPELHLRALMVPNVSYTLYSQLPFDCYYRLIDKSSLEIYWQQSFESYLQYFDKIVVNYNILVLDKKLRYTAFKSLFLMTLYFYWNNIHNQAFTNQILSFLEKVEVLGIYKNKDLKYFKEIILLRESKGISINQSKDISNTIYVQAVNEMLNIQSSKFNRRLKKLYRLLVNKVFALLSR